MVGTLVLFLEPPSGDTPRGELPCLSTHNIGAYLRIDTPSPKTEVVVDYDLTLNSGKEIQFTLCPYLGDTIATDAMHLALYFARTTHHVTVAHGQIAVLSRRERTITLLPETLDPQKDASGTPGSTRSGPNRVA